MNKCQYCSIEIEVGYVGYEEGCCEMCYEMYEQEEEEE